MNCMIQLNEIFCYDCGINMRMKAASVLAMYSRDPFIAVTTIFTTTGNINRPLCGKITANGTQRP